MNIDDLLRETDPARGHPSQAGPGLLDRILDAGPAQPSTGNRTAVLAAALTMVVTLSVAGGLVLLRGDGTAPAGTAAGASPAPSPEDACLALVRGWRPTYVPTGFALHGPERTRGAFLREQQYVRKSAQQPRELWYLSLTRRCTDPALRPDPTTPGEATPQPAPPDLTVRGRPARIWSAGNFLEISWEERPELTLSLMTSSGQGADDRTGLLSVAELVRVAEGLRQEKVTADPTPPPPPCPGLGSYRARTLPPGYRAVKVVPDGDDSLRLTFAKGNGKDTVHVIAELVCELIVGEDPARGAEPVTVQGKQAWLNEEASQVMWQEGPNDFWVIVGLHHPERNEIPNAPRPTREEVLAFAEGLRKG